MTLKNGVEIVDSSWNPKEFIAIKRSDHFLCIDLRESPSQEFKVPLGIDFTVPIKYFTERPDDWL